MLVGHALTVSDRARIERSLAIAAGIAFQADRPKVLCRLAPAFRVAHDVIRAPSVWLFQQFDCASAHVAGEALPAQQIEPGVSANADPSSFGAVACHSGTWENVSTFPGLRSRIGGMMSATLRPVSDSIVSATASNSAHADK